MIRRVTVLSALIALVTSGGIAFAAFPASAPVKTGELAVAGFPQKVAVDLTDDTGYMVSTGPGVITAANPRLTTTSSASAGAQPVGVAVDSDDDTIYVTDANTPGQLLAFTPSLTLARQVPTFRQPRGVAVHPIDDTVYVVFMDDSLTIFNGANLDDSLTVGVGRDPYTVAVNPQDDTIYTANYTGANVSIVSPDGQSVSNVSLAGVGTGVSPLGLAVHPTDDTVYVGGTGQRGLVVGSPDLSTLTLVPLNGPLAEVQDISISPDGSTIYIATPSNSNSIIALNATNLDDSYLVPVGSDPTGAAATDWGAYFALNGSQTLVVTAVTPTLTGVLPNSGPTSGGTALTISGTGFVAGRTTATLGGLPLAVTVVNSTTLMATTPAGAQGPADLVVTVGPASATVSGGFTYISPQPPSVPPSAPFKVAAAAGDSSALVSWEAPASPGSFPITNYQVISSPGGRSCLTASLSCTVAGLSNGAAYTFTVRALNGAGWSTLSLPSNAVTPAGKSSPTITITGSREGGRIAVSGTTTGFGMGGELTPWFRLAGKDSFRQGTKTILVSADGTFTWGRKSSKKTRVYMATPDGSVWSNTVTIPAR